MSIIFTCNPLSCDDGSNMHVLMIVLPRTTECRGSHHTIFSGAQKKPNIMAEALQADIWYYVSTLVAPSFPGCSRASSRVMSHISQRGAPSSIQLTTINSASDMPAFLTYAAYQVYTAKYKHICPPRIQGRCLLHPMGRELAVPTPHPPLSPQQSAQSGGIYVTHHQHKKRGPWTNGSLTSRPLRD